ncbi:2,3-diaminopropionate biosynthesis protein SbnA [Paenibacillus sp. HB172176]|uniref:2,3-diaminopropionate biosynthesis protein SbnA n=1 Tax=Paenibacillus sp. HB172176 TaxID=2493690 RepID=UPI00143A7D1C|nr:2,3-diaminopropionate biosynthesis protein SbnA [Paenibacillus sp. HB172176]
MMDDWTRSIGNTPLVKLSRLFRNSRGIEVYAKLELMNPGGSAKDRPALRILQHAWKDGKIGPGSVVIESSSGNMAISLAAICSMMELKFISVIDPRTAAHNIRIMKTFGAQISYVDEPDPASGEFLPARLARVRELLGSIPNSYWPNQYGNEHNYLAHCEGTMGEIAAALPRVDYVIGGVSTCGTMYGCANYIAEQGMETKVVAVDAKGSVILGGSKGPRMFPGLGAGIVPPFGQKPFMDESTYVSDRNMVLGCKELVAREAILAGPSSGAVISAMKSLLDTIPEQSVCVVIIHDRGERYMDTVYDDDWVKRQFDSELKV